MSRTTFYGLTYTVEMALSAATGTYGAWNSGLWDTATWGPDVIWVDVSQWVTSIQTRRAFDRLFEGWDSGTASFTLRDEDGRFNPLNLAGPYVTAGVTQLRPWRPVRIRFGWAGTTYEAFTGYIQNLPEDYISAYPGGGGALVTVNCVDEFASLARFGGVALADPVGGSESSGQRIHRVLNNAGHAGLRDIDVGRMTMQPTDLRSNTLVELKVTADSEGGAIYVGRDGSIVFRDIYSLIERTASNTIQATFGDGAGELPYSDAPPVYTGDTLVNIAAFARNGSENTVVSADATSRALYGDSQDPRGDLMCETDTQVQTLADLWVQRFKDPEYRFATVVVKPRNRPTVLFPQALGREIRDLIRVRRRPPGGLLISQDSFISGVSHSMSGADFSTVFELASSKPYTNFTTSRFDTGKWDTATWFY
jgi:hypothetical protein